MGHRKKLRSRLPIMVIYSIPILIGYWYVFTYSVNVPFWDQWDTIVVWTKKWYEGELGFNDLLGLYNDSRVTFPMLFILIISLATALNIKLFYIISFTTYLISLALLFYLIKKDMDLDEKTLLLLSPILFYALNPYYLIRYIENIGAFISPFILLMAIPTHHFIYKAKNSYNNMFFATSFGFICSFSAAPGLTIWLSGLAQLIMQRMAGKWKKVAIWVAIATLTFYAHFVLLSVHQKGIHSMEGYWYYMLTALNYPIHKFLCFMGVIGAEVSHYKQMALPFGLVISSIFLSFLLANRKRLDLDNYSKWYGLLIFGALMSLELALTRSGDLGGFFGPPDEIFFIPSSRHQVAFFLPIICIYVLGIAYVKGSSENEDEDLVSKKMLRSRKMINVFLMGMIFTLLISGMILHSEDGLKTGRVAEQNGRIRAYILTTYKIQSDENIREWLYPHTHLLLFIRERAKFLEENKLSVFSSPMMDISELKPIGSDALFWIDAINGRIISQQKSPIIIYSEKEGTITITGWAVDKRANDSASAVFITIDGRMDVPALYGLDRPDVAEAHGNPRFRHSGFMATFSSKILDKGGHTLSIKIVSKDGRGYYRPLWAVSFVIK